jgi:hypothetical protein
MAKEYELNLELSQEEIEYIKELLTDEVFQLSGLKKIKDDVEIKDELKIAEKLKLKFQQVKLQAA